MKGQTYVVMAIIFVIVVAIFAVTNISEVEVNYLFWSGKAPLVFIILFSVLMGGIITAAVGIVKMFRFTREIRKLQLENTRLEELITEHGLLDTASRNEMIHPDDDSDMQD